MINKNQQLKGHSDVPQQNAIKGSQPKFPQLKVHTGVIVGECYWDPRCEKYWC